MDIKCSICQRNGTDKFMNCLYRKDYILDETVYYDFPQFEDLDLIEYNCPKFYYLEFQFLYKLLNENKNNITSFDESFYYRNSMYYYKHYINISKS